MMLASPTIAGQRGRAAGLHGRAALSAEDGVPRDRGAMMVVTATIGAARSRGCGARARARVALMCAAAPTIGVEREVGG